MTSSGYDIKTGRGVALDHMTEETKMLNQDANNVEAERMHQVIMQDDQCSKPLSSSHSEECTKKNETGKLGRERETWSNKLDYFFSVVGGFIGLGNVWRFPYLCYRNGGGAFLIPYAIFLAFGGIPLFFLEVSQGQYTGEGFITVWKMLPIGYGIGYGTMVLLFLLDIYYIVILAWAFFYFFQSFTLDLPWAKCDHEWNTPCCVETFSKTPSVSGVNHSDNGTAMTTLSTLVSTMMSSSSGDNGTICNGTRTSPEVEYWEHRVLGISSGIDDAGSIRWELALCLLLSWTLSYLCIWKGIKYSGKVVYFTATFPYVMLLILLIRGITLPGALSGIKYFLVPDFSRLADSQMWVEAGSQVFFSLALAMGCQAPLGSYNKFNNNCHKDCLILSLMNPLTSFLCGFVVFSVLGFMAQEQGVSIATVAASGPGLAFIAYPKAVTMMPASSFWAVLFFFMILLIGMDSLFIGVECMLKSLIDASTFLRQLTYNKEILAAAICIISFLLGLPMVTNGGIYVLQLFDYYAASGVCLLWVAFFETVAIAWVYGADRMWDNITRMVGYRPLPVFKYMWIFTTPLLALFTLVPIAANFKPLVYNNTYHYPDWAQALGWLLTLSSILVLPFFVFYQFLTTDGTFMERLKTLTNPDLSPTHIDYKREEPVYSNHLEKILGKNSLVFERRPEHYTVQTKLTSHVAPSCPSAGDVAPGPPSYVTVIDNRCS